MMNLATQLREQQDQEVDEEAQKDKEVEWR